MDFVSNRIMRNSQRADVKRLKLSPEVAEQHRKEYYANIKAHRLLSNIVCGAALSATAGKLLYDSTKPESKGFMAAFKNQFKPLITLIEKDKKTPMSIFKFIPLGFWETCKSFPKFVSIPTAILIGLNTMSVVGNQNRINIKYDTINTIKNSEILNNK